MKRVFVIGGATLDTIITYEEMETLVHERLNSQQSYLLLEEGKKIEVLEQKAFSGGGATNAAVSFRRQGYEVGLLCKIGRDAAGSFVLDELKHYGLDVSEVRYADNVGTSSSFVVPSLKGDRTVFAYRGANTTLLAEELPLNNIVQSQFIYITSLSKASAQRLPEIVTAAKQQNVMVAVNPGISQLKLGGAFLKSALTGIHTLILNYEEAQQFMSSLLHSDGPVAEAEPEKLAAEGSKLALDKPVSFEDVRFSLRQFFKKVLNLGPEIVVVTNGAEGVYVATKTHLYFHRSLPVKVLNTLGAGDAFGSGFVGAVQRGDSIADAIRSGLVNSASVIQYADAKSGLLTLQQVRAECAKIKPDWLMVMDWSK